MTKIVALKKRNTGTVKSGTSFNSVATSTGVLRFLNKASRPGQSPLSSSMLKKNTPNEDGIMYTTC